APLAYPWRRWARRVAALFGLRVRVRGTPPPAPCLLVANHLSYLDILVLATQMDIVFVAKAEVARWPVIGFLGRAAGTVFIDRARKRDLPRVIQAMTDALRRGQRVAFFPEGTSSAGALVLPFHSPLFEAAVRAGVPVRYASLTYRTTCDVPPASRAVCWWGDMTFARHLYALLQLSGVRATVSFGRDAVEAGNRKRLAARARTAVMRLFSPVAPSPTSAPTRTAAGGRSGTRGRAVIQRLLAMSYNRSWEWSRTAPLAVRRRDRPSGKSSRAF
ncbi:MAG: lysophospholipid acyltransferase family protein, partial [Thermodesulfobacteriota bacterium]